MERVAERLALSEADVSRSHRDRIFNQTKTMTAILIATIGTRDLMFQISSGDWFNIGDDRMQDGDIIGEQAEVISDLSLSKISYRDLTKYLLERQDQYMDRIKPVIIGKLLTERATQIDKLYLIGTDQPIDVSQRSKDTIYGCELIKAWVEKNYQIPTMVVSLGTDGTNPSNFEAMFEWWRKTWCTEIDPPIDREIWLGLKGGVGQTSEAGRISGLSLYGDRIQFFEFHQNEKHNRAGNPSAYSGPFLGTNYLWDRTQQQALKLLDRFDYAGAEELLKPYLQTKNLGAVPNLIKAGIAWNQGEFDSFLKYAKSTNILNPSQQKQSQTWWWMAYEQAYLGVIRLEQNNTVEAMLHSFRAIEGGLLEWARANLGDNFKDNGRDSPIVLDSILESHPKLKDDFKSKNAEKRGRGELEQHVLWMLISVQRGILKGSLPAALEGGFEYFWSDDCRKKRNKLSHRLGGISKREVLSAWGEDIKDPFHWDKRVVSCLNILTGQSFESLHEASLFAKVHDRVKQSIEQA